MADLIQKLQQWLDHLGRLIAGLVQTAISSVGGFFRHFFDWVLESLQAALGFLQRLGLTVINTVAYWLGQLLKWAAIGIGSALALFILLHLVLVLAKLLHDAWRYRETLPTFRTIVPGYGTMDTRLTRDSSRATPHSFSRPPRNREQGAEERARNERLQQERAREARSRQMQVEAANREAEESNRKFAKFLHELDLALSNRTTMLSVPKPPDQNCEKSICQQKRNELNICFCVCSIRRMLESHIEVDGMTGEKRREFIKKTMREWHPDKFWSCPKGAEMVQIMEELFKAVSSLK